MFPAGNNIQKRIKMKFNLLETLPVGTMLDLIRCRVCYKKFNGNKCVSLKSAISLSKRDLIKKNNKNIWIPTTLGIQMVGEIN